MNSIRSYALFTGAYWGFTVTDGALRMLVVLHFYQLGYDSISIAFLFLFYEFFGIVTNLFGGWIADASGVKVTLLRRAGGGRSSRSSCLRSLNQHWSEICIGGLRDGGTGAVWHCRRTHEDERQECHQSHRA